jgi:hypothetical protein
LASNLLYLLTDVAIICAYGWIKSFSFSCCLSLQWNGRRKSILAIVQAPGKCGGSIKRQFAAVIILAKATVRVFIRFSILPVDLAPGKAQPKFEFVFNLLQF